jgi:hypothetical protein
MNSKSEKEQLQNLQDKIQNSDFCEADKRYLLDFIQGKKPIEIAKEVTTAFFAVLDFIETVLKPIAENYPNSIYAEKYKTVYDYRQKTAQETIQNAVLSSFNKPTNIPGGIM